MIDSWDAPYIVREYLETGNESMRSAAESAAAKSAAWSAAKSAAMSAQIAKFIEMIEEEETRHTSLSK